MSSKIVTKKKLIESIAAISGRDIYAVKDVINTMQDVIFDYISSVDKNNNDITIKLFDGFGIDVKYIPKHEKTNNLTGKTINVDSKVKTRLNVTRTYRNKLSSKKNKIF